MVKRKLLVIPDEVLLTDGQDLLMPGEKYDASIERDWILMVDTDKLERLLLDAGFDIHSPWQHKRGELGNATVFIQPPRWTIKGWIAFQWDRLSYWWREKRGDTLRQRVDRYLADLAQNDPPDQPTPLPDGRSMITGFTKDNLPIFNDSPQLREEGTRSHDRP